MTEQVNTTQQNMTELLPPDLPLVVGVDLGGHTFVPQFYAVRRCSRG